MRKSLIVTSLLLAAIICSGCIANGLATLPRLATTASANTLTRQVDLDNFTSVEASSAFTVHINRGEGYRVVVTADENLMERVRVNKVGSTLKVYVDNNWRSPRSFGLGILRAEITMPALEAVRLSGASQGVIGGFASDRDLDVDLSGASRLEGEAAARTVRIEVSGASQARLNGLAEELQIRGSGASRLDLPGLVVEAARADLSGAASAVVHASTQLDYALSGGSRLEYQGHPEVGQASISGGSSSRAQ